MNPEEPRPAVSVFVATYDAAPLLRLALRSVLRQDMADFEVLVTGDGCTDDSERVVSSFGDARLIFRNRASNSGSQAAAHNDAIPRARGEWVAYLGHDDLWFPAHLSSLLAFARESRADAVHSLCALLAPGSAEAIGAPKPGVPYTRHFVPPSSLIHRRSLFDEIGPWGDPDLLPMPVDREFLSRAARRGARIAFLPRLTVLKWPSALWRSYSPAVEAWGRERWPLRPYFVRRLRRQRREARIRRGLPPA